MKSYWKKAAQYPCLLRWGILESNPTSPETFVSETEGFRNPQMGSLSWTICCSYLLLVSLNRKCNSPSRWFQMKSKLWRNSLKRWGKVKETGKRHWDLQREGIAIPTLLEPSRGRAKQEQWGWEPGRDHRSKTTAIYWRLPLVRPSQEPEQSIRGDVVNRGRPRRASWKMDLQKGKQKGSNQRAPVHDRLKALIM